jgi:hypothetical protein
VRDRARSCTVDLTPGRRHPWHAWSTRAIRAASKSGTWFSFNSTPTRTERFRPYRSGTSIRHGFRARDCDHSRTRKNLTDFSGHISNYETDIFRPIFDEIEKLSGKKYASTLPNKTSRINSQHNFDRHRFRVIADHIRTLAFAIADGIIPSNEGRGYVLRRDSAARGSLRSYPGFHEPFFFQTCGVVAKTMGDVFSEVRAKQEAIEETIRAKKRRLTRPRSRIRTFAKARLTRSKHYVHTADSRKDRL